jgi:hypothetical protein
MVPRERAAALMFKSVIVLFILLNKYNSLLQPPVLKRNNFPIYKKQVISCQL